jgi:uncharacterized protein with gpF-like domain
MSLVAMPTTTPTAPKTVKEIDLKPGTINTEKQIEAMRKAAWIKLNDQVNPLIGKTAKQLRGYFRSINQKLLKRVMGLKTVKQITKDDIEPLVATLLDDDALEAILAKETEAALITGASTVQALGDFDIKTMLAKRMDRIKGINETTRQLIIDKFQDVLVEAAAQGLTEAERAQALINAAEGIADFNMKRARTIARTEMHSAFSMGRSESAKEFGATHKRWVADTFNSAGVKESHGLRGGNRMYMHGEKVGINEPYKNGCQFPLDPEGAPEETINCRCVEVYEFEDDAVKSVKSQMPEVKVTKTVGSKKIDIIRDKNGVMMSAVIAEEI